MATKKTYINADQELVIQGKLTIEGEVVQQENTVKVNNLQSDELVINSDGQNTTARLTFNSNGTFSNMSYADGGNIIAEPGLQGNLFVANGQSIIIDGGGSIGGTGFTGNLTGTASNANALTSAVTLNLGGDATGSTTFINAGDNSTITTTLANTTVTPGTYGNAITVGQFTVDSKGRLTGANNFPINITASQVSDFSFAVNTQVEAAIIDGDGLTYTTITPSARGFFSVGANADNSIIVNTNDIQLNVAYTRNQFSATDTGGDGSFAYNSSTGVFTYTGPSASEVRAHFTGGYGVTLSSGDISLTNSEVQAQANVAIGNNSNIVLTDNNQSISGSKTFTSDVEIQGNLNVTANINSATQVDLFVEDTNITLRQGAVSDGDAHINVVRSSGTRYLKWNDTSDRWQFNNAGTDQNMLLFSDFSGGTGITFSSGAISITNSGVTGASYGSATAIPTFTVNSQGQLTTAADVNIAIPASQVTDFSEAVDDRVNSLLVDGDGITGTYNDGAGSYTIDVDSTVIRTTGDQSLAGDKTFTGKLLIPTTDVTTENAIFTDSNEAWIYVNGSKKQITPTSSIGSAEEANSSLTYTNLGTTGTSTFEIYAGQRTVGADTFHAIKGLEAGSNVLITSNATALTIDANIASIYEKFSVVSGSGDGSLSYNNTNGTFTYTGPTPAEVRSHILGSGLIGYNSGTGVISTSADNYAAWNFTTDSAGNQQITSGGLLTFTAGSGIDVTHSGSTITIATDSDADISSVGAGAGLTGGGVSGAVTLNVVGGFGITVNADDIELNNTSVRSLFSASDSGGDGSFSYNSGTGVFTYTGPSASEVRAHFSGSNGVNYNSTTGAITADSAEIRALFSATGDISYNSSTGVISFTNDAGDIESVSITAGTGLTGTASATSGAFSTTLNVTGLTVSELAPTSLLTSSETFADSDTQLMTAKAIDDRIISKGYSTTTGTVTNVSGGNGLTGSITASGSLNVGAGSYIIVNANDVAVDATTAATANKVVARDGAGNVAANYFVGTATAAQYADLAEKYEADADYEPGTVLVIGGEKEVTVTDEAGSYKVVGVVSTDPAYLMNSQANGVAVALRGRVPCKVIGNVNKGDVLIASDTPGHAMVGASAHTLSPLQIVGRALETKTDAQPGIIEIIV